MADAAPNDWHRDPNSLRGTRLRVEPSPDWVVRRKVRDSGRKDGLPVTMLLLDRQIYPDGMSRYTRYVRRLETPQSVQDAGKIELSFDPATQVQLIHAISIFRAGELKNHANLDEVKLIQREPDLDKGVYDGSITALLLLKDLRTGDVIDIETSVTSDDSIFPSHYWFQENFEHLLTINIQYFSWLSNHHERFRIDDSTMPIKPEVEETPFGLRKVWMQEKQPSVELPAYLPAGLNPFSHLSISSFSSWGDVAVEFSKLWKRSEKPGDLLPAELEALREMHAENPVALIEAVVAFVRDNIRYQGVETGRLGLVPDELHLIWERRFGDCKEKTSILCWMLRECGFEATPALVSSMMRGRVSDQLPAPVFDHVVVHLRYGGEDHWMDPTNISQRGRLANWISLPFGKALLISPDTTGFITIRGDEPGRNSLVVVEEYEFPKKGRDAEITVTHTYRGADADQVRHTVESRGRIVVQQIFSEIVKSTRSNAELKTDLEITDNPEENVMTLRSKFFAPETLSNRGAAASLSADFVPHSVIGKIVGIDDKPRSHPLGLLYPIEVEHSTILRHPDAKDAVVPKVIIDNEFMKFVAGTEKEGGSTVLKYKFMTKVPEIPAEHIKRYRANLKQIGQVISLTFETKATGKPYTSASASETRSGWEEELTPSVTRYRGYDGGRNASHGSSSSRVPYWLLGVVVFIILKILVAAMSGM